MPLPSFSLQFQKIAAQAFSNHANEILFYPLAIAAAVSLLLLLLRGLLLRKMSSGDDSVSLLKTLGVSIFKNLSFFWCFIGGLYVGVAVAKIPSSYAKPIYQSINALLILSLTWALTNLVASLFLNRLQRKGNHSTSNGLILGVLKAGILIPGVLLTLSILGVSVAPLLTALGVGGLAVALALKDTLENFFAGIHMLFDKAIKVGDVIRLDSGQEGIVRDIGLRTTRVYLSEGNMLIIPNSKLAQSIVTNFSLPSEDVTLSIPFLVAYGNSIEKIEGLMLQAVKTGTEDIVGFQSFPAPYVRFHPGFTPNGLELNLVVHVDNYASQSFVRHELRKRVYQKLLEHQVTFPKQP